MHVTRLSSRFALAAVVFCCRGTLQAQQQSSPLNGPKLIFDVATAQGFPIFKDGHAASVCVANDDLAPVLQAVSVFQDDVQKLSGVRPESVSGPGCGGKKNVILVGSLGHSSLLSPLLRTHRIPTTQIEGKWESAIVQIAKRPMPGVENALVIAGSDARGAAFALYDLSRAMGVSPWTWWADVPVTHHRSAVVVQQRYVQAEPAVRYRGIFLNDEDWGLRPWAAHKMDASLNNIGPITYARVFELLLRLHANTLWPAMHPGSMPFHLVPENTRLAAQWGIVMSSSHSEAILRNNVGEWDEARDGPWNYQSNRAAIDRYWDDRAKANGRFENIYTVGMRGQHDSGLEASGTAEVKARLLEQVIADQRTILANRVNHNLQDVPQVLWLYKESIDMYRAGMKVPDDVTLGWTDDNYGYLRQLPNAEEQKRSGGSALYYHISYFGAPHDYLWLATTPLALMQEELTKAWDHGTRRAWILNVGDIKPGEQEIDYFLQLAWQLPQLRNTGQRAFSTAWFAQNFPPLLSERMAAVSDEYMHLNFIRKPEFMGFNGYTDEVNRTRFNPLAWGDQNRKRLDAWDALETEANLLAIEVPASYQDAFYQLLLYPVAVSAAQNRKFLWADRSFVDHHAGDPNATAMDAGQVFRAFNSIQDLTSRYNRLSGGKWEGMMSWHPRDRRVFEQPETALFLATAPEQLPGFWNRGVQSTVVANVAGSGAIDGYVEEFRTISMDATHFSAKIDTPELRWQTWAELGLSSGSIGIAAPGLAKQARWTLESGTMQTAAVPASPSLQYDFTVTQGGEATAKIALLPTFPIDSEHRLRYAIRMDNAVTQILDASGSEERKPGLSDWPSNVLRNAAMQTIPLGLLAPGHHSLKIYYGDPGVMFQNISVTFSGAPEAYPYPPETTAAPRPEETHAQKF